MPGVQERDRIVGVLAAQLGVVAASGRLAVRGASSRIKDAFLGRSALAGTLRASSRTEPDHRKSLARTSKRPPSQLNVDSLARVPESPPPAARWGCDLPPPGGNDT